MLKPIAGATAAAALVAAAGVGSIRPPKPIDAFTPRQAVLVLLRDKNHPATRDGRQLWALQRPLTYRTHAGETVTVPAGMVTDLASIPRPVSPLVAPDGPYAQAALIHDGCYATHGSFVWHRVPADFHGSARATPYDRAGCDTLLDQAMADLGVSAWQRWTVYGGVRAAGSHGWGH